MKEVKGSLAEHEKLRLHGFPLLHFCYRALFTREAFPAALWALSEPTTETTSPEPSGTPGAHQNAKRAPPLFDQAPPKGGDQPEREKRGTRRATGGVRTPGGRCFPSRITTAGGCRRRRKISTPPGLTAARAQARPGRHAQSAELQRGSGGNQPQRALPARPAQTENRRLPLCLFEAASGTNGGTPEASNTILIKEF